MVGGGASLIFMFAIDFVIDVIVMVFVIDVIVVVFCCFLFLFL